MSSREIVHSRVIKSSINAWKWTTSCLTSWMYYNPQTLAPYFRQKNWFYMVSQNRVNIPPIARKNVTQRGGWLARLMRLFVLCLSSILPYIYIYIVWYPVHKNSTTTRFIYYVSKIWLCLPVWRPLRLASFLNETRAREWTTVGFLIIKPSRCKREMLRREFANAISFVSFGSNQIFRWPHFNTDAARRFCKRRLAVIVFCFV